MPPHAEDLSELVDSRTVTSAEVAAARLLRLLPVLLNVAAEQGTAAPLVDAMLQVSEFGAIRFVCFQLRADLLFHVLWCCVRQSHILAILITYS